MLELVNDLYRHHAWADAEQWKAVREAPEAMEDTELKKRLVHLHGAQQVWLGRWQGVPLLFPEPSQFGSIDDLYHFARSCHVALHAFLGTLTEARLQEPVTYKSLSDEAFTQPLQDLMLHLVFHSQYHRGQNALRMRALGHQMPGTDLVFWQRMGRPQARWS